MDTCHLHRFTWSFSISWCTDAVCECVKEINDYCCQTPNPQSKDACCHIEGFKQKEPKWICNKRLGDHECEGDADCVSNGSKGKCHRCKCVTAAEPPIDPFPSCLPENECRTHVDCMPKQGERCECNGCDCHCFQDMSGTDCPADAVCKTDADCKVNGTSAIEGATCVECVCMSEMAGTCGEDSECITDEYCQEGLDPKKMRAWCDQGACVCMTEELPNLDEY